MLDRLPEDKQKKRKQSPLQSIYSFLSSPDSRGSKGSSSIHAKSLSALLSPKINTLWNNNKDKQKLENSNSNAEALHTAIVLPPREDSHDSKFTPLNSSSSKYIQGRPKTTSFNLIFWKASPPKERKQEVSRKDSPLGQLRSFCSPKVIGDDSQGKNCSGLETSNVSNLQGEIPNNNGILKTKKRFHIGCIGTTKLLDRKDIVKDHAMRKLNVF